MVQTHHSWQNVMRFLTLKWKNRVAKNHVVFVKKYLCHFAKEIKNTAKTQELQEPFWNHKNKTKLARFRNKRRAKNEEKTSEPQNIERLWGRNNMGKRPKDSKSIRKLYNATHLAEPVPAGIFCFVCVSSAMVSRHQSVFETFHVNGWFSFSDSHCMMFVKRWHAIEVFQRFDLVVF